MVDQRSNNKTWSLQEAKARFSEVIRLCQQEPQLVSVRGEQKAVILSIALFQAWSGKRPKLEEVLKTLPCHLSGKKLNSRNIF